MNNDPNERMCGDCKEHFVPYSIGRTWDATGELPLVPIPVDYQCLSCRAKVPA